VTSASQTEAIRAADGSVSSAAFMTRSKKPDLACSVYLARLTTPEAVLAAAPPHLALNVAALGAEIPIAMGLAVVHDPQSPDVESVHYARCEIRGLSTKAQCRQLVKACIIVGDTSS
jgi:hypothetical protein